MMRDGLREPFHNWWYNHESQYKYIILPLYVYYTYIYIWVFPKIMEPQTGWFIRENPIKMDDLGGFPLFLETPIKYMYSNQQDFGHCLHGKKIGAGWAFLRLTVLNTTLQSRHTPCENHHSASINPKVPFWGALC